MIPGSSARSSGKGIGLASCRATLVLELAPAPGRLDRSESGQGSAPRTETTGTEHRFAQRPPSERAELATGRPRWRRAAKTRVYPVAEGMLAAALFGVAGVVVYFIGIGTIYR